jgi:hypothetical protein
VRHNETTRVAAVLEQLRTGTRQAAIDALMLLWIEEPERPDEIDGAAIDAWHAIVEAGAVDAAIAAGLALLRSGTRIRRHAFVELTEQVPDVVLVELAELALAAGWRVDPYVAAILVRLAERSQPTLVFQVIERHRERFESETELWELVMFVITTTLVGDGVTVARWFKTWKVRKPRMWIVAAYAGTLFEGLERTELTGKALARLVELATEVCDELVWDDSAALFVCLRMVGDLQQDRLAEFDAALTAHRERIAAAIATSRLHHPIVRFASSLKHAHPVVGEQLDAPRAPLSTMRDPRGSVINRQLAYVVHDLTTAVANMLEALELYAELRRIAPGDRRIRALAKRMRILERDGAGGWIRSAWVRLFKQRATWRQRLPF